MMSAATTSIIGVVGEDEHDGGGRRSYEFGVSAATTSSSSSSSVPTRLGPSCRRRRRRRRRHRGRRCTWSMWIHPGPRGVFRHYYRPPPSGRTSSASPHRLLLPLIVVLAVIPTVSFGLSSTTTSSIASRTTLIARRLSSRKERIRSLERSGRSSPSIRRQDRAMTTKMPSPYTVRTVGQPNTFEHRVFVERDGLPVSWFHDIPLYANEQHTILNMVVEIPRWTNAKLEVRRERHPSCAWRETPADRPGMGTPLRSPRTRSSIRSSKTSRRGSFVMFETASPIMDICGTTAASLRSVPPPPPPPTTPSRAEARPR